MDEPGRFGVATVREPGLPSKAVFSRMLVLKDVVVMTTWVD